MCVQRKRMNMLMWQYDAYWRQRANTWYKDDDQNTIFFHAGAMPREKVN